MHKIPPFRVLTLDGGGMRGTYTATYLDRVAAAFAERRSEAALDIGAAFDLIVGTSTGGIIACALAAGVPLSSVVELYRKHGAAIFQRPLPSSLTGATRDYFGRSAALSKGEAALRAALVAVLGDTTARQLYERRGIALAITAVEMSQHHAWVFKTPHFESTNHRDDAYSLVDVCLATSAAPIFRSLAAVGHPGRQGDGYNVFVDGGLWANNPVLVGLIEARHLPGTGWRTDSAWRCTPRLDRMEIRRRRRRACH
jgi:patatin-like phospholipase/acyl hydrolase